MLTKKQLRQQNERLRGLVTNLTLKNIHLETRIKAYELSKNAPSVDIYGVEMYQRSLIGSEYTKQWCEGQIRKEISRHIMEKYGDRIEYTNQIVDDKHAIMTGKMTISVKEVE